MSQISTELWRKSEIVSLDKFPVGLQDSIKRGLQVMRGEIAEETCNESKTPDILPHSFTAEEMDILRDKLGPQLVHGDHSLQELRDIISTSHSGPSNKFKRS